MRKKRVLRIYPGFLVAILLCIFVFGPLGAVDPSLYWSSLWHHPKVFKDALNLSVSWNDAPFRNTLTTIPFPHIVDGSLWTIRYECLCYSMLAALGTGGLLLSKHLPRWLVYSCPAVLFFACYTLYAGLLYGHFGNWTNYLYPHALTGRLLGYAGDIPRLFVYFIAGMCLYTYRRQIPFNTPLLLIALAGIVASALLPPLLPLTFPILGSYAILALAFAPWLRLSRIGSRNDLSYGLYLYGFPIEQLLVLYFGRHLTPITEFLAALPITAIFAWASWKLIEKPALSLKENLPKGNVRTRNLQRTDTNVWTPAEGIKAENRQAGSADHLRLMLRDRRMLP